jgi:hypothetical protein
LIFSVDSYSFAIIPPWKKELHTFEEFRIPFTIQTFISTSVRIGHAVLEKKSKCISLKDRWTDRHTMGNQKSSLEI